MFFMMIPPIFISLPYLYANVMPKKSHISTFAPRAGTNSLWHNEFLRFTCDVKKRIAAAFC